MPAKEGWAAGKDAAWKKFQEFHERKIQESSHGGPVQEARDRESEETLSAEQSAEQSAEDTPAAAPEDLQC